MATENQDMRRETRDPATDDGIEQALHEMRDGLTVIHAYAQLLQRHIHPRLPVEHDALHDRLEIIERTAMAMERRLRQLESHHSADR